MPPTKAQALAAAQAVVVQQGQTSNDLEAGRIVNEYLDTWQSRWGNPQALCDGFGKPINQ